MWDNETDEEEDWAWTRRRTRRGGRKRLIQDPGRITIDMEKRDLERLRALAASRALSASELIRRAVLQYLKRSGG